MRMNRRVAAMAAVIKIARHFTDTPIDGAIIAEQVTGNRRGLEQVYRILVAAGILKGRRGARGGYLLAKPAGQITLADIHKAISPLETWCAPDYDLVQPLGLAEQSYLRVLGQWTISAVLDAGESRGGKGER
jgi:DNA-binding IscR family transcriptional regulator